MLASCNLSLQRANFTTYLFAFFSLMCDTVMPLPTGTLPSAAEAAAFAASTAWLCVAAACFSERRRVVAGTVMNTATRCVSLMIDGHFGVGTLQAGESGSQDHWNRSDRQPCSVKIPRRILLWLLLLKYLISCSHACTHGSEHSAGFSGHIASTDEHLRYCQQNCAIVML